MHTLRCHTHEHKIQSFLLRIYTRILSQHLSICHLCLTRQHILKAKIYAVTFINDESNTVMKEEILFYFIMIKQNRTIIEQNIINLLKNIIICIKKKINKKKKHFNKFRNKTDLYLSPVNGIPQPSLSCYWTLQRQYRYKETIE